jgi:nitronate monooxygenase
MADILTNNEGETQRAILRESKATSAARLATFSSSQPPPFHIMQRQAIAQLRSALPWTSVPLVVGAPMRVLSGPSLAFEVSKAGGLGFVGPGARPEDLESALIQTSKLVEESGPLSSPICKLDLLPIGVGFQTWAGNLATSARILTEHRKPSVIWLFAPRHGQKELDEWTNRIREISPDTQIWIQVASVADALAAAPSSDVLVIQGTDAGGHSLKKGAGIVTLLPEVSDALASQGHTGIPLIAAGGIADSRGVAAAFALGAAGVAMGTRLLASKEAAINPAYQRHVVEASDGGQHTVRTQFYNHLRGTMDWPKAFDARGIINQSWRDHEEGVPFEQTKRLHDEALKLDKAWGFEGRTATYAGTGIGLVKEVKGAGEIIKEVRNGFEDVLKVVQEATIT